MSAQVATETATGYGLALFPQHAAMLAASGITPETARARGYVSVDTKVRLDRLGITAAGRNVPGLLVPMRDVTGAEWGYQYRPDVPRERAGKAVKYETPAGQRNGIDFPSGVRDMLADLATPLWVTEGVKKADAAVQRGLACIALPGVWSWKGKPGRDPHESTVAVPDWDDVGLKGRGIILAFDSDVMVKPAVRTALERLARFLTMRGAAEVRYLVLPNTGDGKTGLDDFLAEHEVSELGRHVHKVMPEPETGPDSSAGSAGSAGSVSARLARIAQDRYTFGRATTGEPYALPVTGPRIVHMLRGGHTSLRTELAAAYLAKYGTPPTQQALADALTALEGTCMAAEPAQLWLRTAQTDNTLWLDVGDDTGRVIRVDPGGWEVVDTAPVLFRRTALTAPLPNPAPGGNVAALWDLLNVAERDRPLLLGFMVAALLPNMPHPILSLAGEQGTGKSTASRIIGTTLDPSTVPLRKSPRDLESWTTAAAGSHVVAVDNVSGLPDWLSDALCRASTGDGDVRRRLYSDGDLYVSSFRRVVIVNGIDLGTVRDDLADRLVTVELDRIGEDRRERDGDLTARWQAAAPGILAGLLDLTAEVLAVLPTVRLDRSPRMADFAHILAAVDRVRGTDSLGRYRDLSGELAADAVASDPVLTALTAAVTGPWSGAAAELLPALEATLGDGRPPREWPRTARSLSGALKRRAPSLRRVGWTVEQTTERTERGQVWHLAPPTDGDTESVREPDERPDEILTKSAAPVSSAVRQPVRQAVNAPMTSEDVQTARNPDELTDGTSNLCLGVQERGETATGQDDMREVPDPSSSRHSVSRAVYTRPGVDYCPECGDPLDGPGLLTRCRPSHEVTR